MHDALAVRVVEGGCNLNRDRDDLIEWDRASRETVSQRLTLDVLHDEKVDSGVMTDVGHGADVRMVEGGDRAGLGSGSLLPSSKRQRFDR